MRDARCGIRIAAIVVCLCCASIATAGDLADEGKAARRLDASFVWTRAEPPGKQEYAVFRRAFDLDQAPAEATLRIFADVRYVLWINGRYVERGPCRFDPKRRNTTFSTSRVTCSAAATRSLCSSTTPATW